MNDAPKRSAGETIGQLVVIAILIAILIGAVILLRQYVDHHNSSAPASTTPASTTPAFSFTCCTGFNPNDTYHPGEVMHLSWTPVEAAPGDYSKRTITLSASLSNAFTSPQAIKSATSAGNLSTTEGPFMKVGDHVHVSSRSSSSPTVTLTIPSDARTGYYELVTTSSQKDYSVTGASIFKIRR